MLSLGEACARMLTLAEPGEPIEIPLSEAVGLVLAEPAVADVDLPPFDRAGQEGYAVRAHDATAGGLLRVVGSVAKGRKALVEPAVELQEAARIVTGEPLPVGADAVVRTEDSRPDAAGSGPPRVIEVLRTVDRGQNVVHRGEWLTAGTVLVPAGSRVKPAMIPLLASQGCVHPVCHRRVRVAILAVGDHLVSPVEAPIMNRERNASNLPLVALAVQSGAMAHDLGAVPEGQIRATMERAFSAPVVVILGEPTGAIPRALKHFQVEAVLQGVSVHPGKRMTYGVVRDEAGRVAHHVFHLPPTPVAALTVFTLLVLPLISNLQGAPTAGPATVRARWEGTHRATDDRLWAVPVSLGHDDQGQAIARLLHARGAADLPGFAKADALALLPPRSGPYVGGETVDVAPLMCHIN